MIKTKVGALVQQGVAAGTISTDQAKQIGADMKNVHQAFQSQDGTQIADAMQKLRGDV